MQILKKCDIIKSVINAVSKVTKEGRSKLKAKMFLIAFIYKMSTKIEVKTFSKKEAQQIIKILKKDLLKKELLESEENEILRFKRYLNKIKLDCIVTTREKIIYSFGVRVKKYQGENISDYLSSCINDNNLASIKGSYLEITNKKNVSGIYMYRPITFRNINIGSLIFSSSKQLTKEQLDFILRF